MERLRKFFRPPGTHRRLVVTSVLLLWTIRWGLWLLPFRTLQRQLANLAQVSPKRWEADQASIDRVVWAVAAASPYVPKATCLTQALTAQVLLARRGHPARLRIGVAWSEAGQFRAHAWVECQGSVVIGGTDAPVHFTPLPPLEGKTG